VSDWGYVAIAYILIGGALIIYTALLAYRVSEARRLAQSLARRERPQESQSVGEDSALCDAPPAL
jgi:hypothetical protein